MTQFDKFSLVQKPLLDAKTVLVVLPQSVDFDKISAGLALYLSLKKSGKNVEIVAPEKLIVEYSSLVGADKVKNGVGGKNLVVSFDYAEDSIEKVSYNIDGGRFNLVIQPKDGFPPLSAEKVVFSASGASADLVFLIGVNNLADLGQLYVKEREFFEKSQTVIIDTLKKEVGLGTISLVDSEASSISEIIGSLIVGLKLSLDQDIAQNLLKGLDEKTSGFSSYKTNADTFELVALCMRAGAKRTPRKLNGNGSYGFSRNGNGRFDHSRRPLRTDFAFKPMPQEESAAKTPAAELPSEEPAVQAEAGGEAPVTFPVDDDQLSAIPLDAQPVTDEDFDVQPQADWFSPKIYKGNSKA
jgi:hypothetical protein